MKKVILVIVFCVGLTSCGLAYLEPSFRVKALGGDFVGLIPDLYSDIFRNPAYLAKLDQPTLGLEYRIEGGRRYLLNAAEPFHDLGSIGIYLKGDVSSRHSQSQTERTYLFYDTELTSLESSGFRDDSHLSQFSFKYASRIGEKARLGFDLNYFEAESEHISKRIQKFTEVYTDSGLVRRQGSAWQQRGYTNFNKYLQPAVGLQFLLSESKELNFRIFLQRVNSEVRNQEIEERLESRFNYDTLGVDTLVFKDLIRRQDDYPLQKITTFGINSDFRTLTSQIPALSFLLNVSFSHIDERAVALDSRTSDRIPSSFNQAWTGEAEKDRFSIEFRVGGESDTLRYSKLFLGLKNRLDFEKGSVPVNSSTSQEKGFRNTLYKITLPVGVEVYPVRGWAVRGSVVSSYSFARDRRYDPIINGISINKNKSTQTIYNLGFGYMLLNKILAEAYVTDVYDFTQLKSWSVSASYAF